MKLDTWETQFSDHIWLQSAAVDQNQVFLRVFYNNQISLFTLYDMLQGIFWSAYYNWFSPNNVDKTWPPHILYSEGFVE